MLDDNSLLPKVVVDMKFFKLGPQEDNYYRRDPQEDEVDTEDNLQEAVEALIQLKALQWNTEVKLYRGRVPLTPLAFAKSCVGFFAVAVAVGLTAGCSIAAYAKSS
jgi:hypothetical protein